jgi:TolB-like protein
MSRFQSLITELRRRKIFRTVGIYIVAAWVTVQVASLVFPAIDVPESALRYVWLIAILLFPLVMVFAWFFDLTTTGLTRTPPADADHGFDPSLRRTDYLILATLSVVAVAVAWQVMSRIEALPEIAPRAINPNSIAVLPLDDISGDPEQQYFVSGMHAALIAGLSRVRALRVTSKASTMTYGNRVRLAVQMLDAEDDEHVWSATFEEDLEDIMILQSRVVQAIAGQVRVTLSADEQERFENVSAVNPAAYEAFLKGQFHVERFTPKDMELAEGYYREAVELDPEYALGYWGLAKLCGFRNQAGVITPEEAREQCLPPILRALDLDPLLPEAHLGYANHMTWRRFDWEKAATAFERAIELNPSYAEARMFYSHYLGIVGRLEESTEQMLKSLELDPLNPFVRALYAVQLLMIDEYEQAVTVAEEVLASAPGFGFGYVVMWAGYHLLDEKNRAIEAAVNYFRHTRGQTLSAEFLESAYDGTNYSAAHLSLAEFLVEQSETERAAPNTIGVLFEYAGDTERAIDWFETAYREYDPDAPYAGVLSKIPETRANPRFQQLLRDMKLDYWAEQFSSIDR